MKAGLLFFTLVASFSTPSDARRCTQEFVQEWIATVTSYATSPMAKKCVEDEGKIGINNEFLYQEAFCKLESCKEAEEHFVELFKDVPVCTVGISRISFARVMLSKLELENVDLCDRAMNGMKAIVAEENSTEALSPSIFAALAARL